MIRNDRGARALLGIGMGVVYLLGLGQLLFQLTGGPQAFAHVLALQGAGALVVLPFSGPFVDAADSRRVYLTCSALRAALVCGVALVAAVDLPGDVILIGAGVFLLAACDNVQRAALFKFTAWHVTAANRSRLNGLLNLAIQVGAILGMAILGVLLLWVSVAAALLADGLVSLASAGFMARVTSPSVGSSAVEPRRRLTAAGLGAALPATFHDWRGMGKRYRGDLPVFGMVALCAVDFVFQGSLSTLIVPLVKEHYGGQGQYVSLLEGAFALGMVGRSPGSSRPCSGFERGRCERSYGPWGLADWPVRVWMRSSLAFGSQAAVGGWMSSMRLPSGSLT